MEKEDTLNYFIRATNSLIRLNSFVDDNFFSDKFNIKIDNLIFLYIKLVSGDKVNVAQYLVALEKVIIAADNILDNIQILIYLNLLKTSPLLLNTDKILLILKMELVKEKNRTFKDSNIKILPNISQESINIPEIIVKKVNKKPTKLNENKKRILDFIKSYPDIRTKDIIQEFNIISDRTVKRNLSDLLQAGLIRKRIDNKAVYYNISE